MLHENNPSSFYGPKFAHEAVKQNSYKIQLINSVSLLGLYQHNLDLQASPETNQAHSIIRMRTTGRLSY